jgi:hypothetical protein
VSPRKENKSGRGHDTRHRAVHRNDRNARGARIPKLFCGLAIDQKRLVDGSGQNLMLRMKCNPGEVQVMLGPIVT